MVKQTRTLSIIAVDLDGSGEIYATVSYGAEGCGNNGTRLRLDLALEEEATSMQHWAQMVAATIVNAL